jgi:hypothetical protein
MSAHDPLSEPPALLRRSSGRWRWLLVVNAVLLVSVGAAVALGLRSAGQCVSSFHEQLDREAYADIYRDASEAFRKADSLANYGAFFADLHRRLGRSQSTERAAFSMSVVGDAGIRVSLRHKTQFANDQATETYLWRYEGGRLRLVQYHVTSPKLAE